MTGPNQDGTYYAYLSPPSTDLKAEQMAADPVKAGAIDAPTLQEAAIKDFQFVSAAIHQYMIPRDLHEDARDHARSLIGTEPYERSRQERKKVEMLFAHLKRHLGFERLRLRGLSGARDEFLLAATVQNLRGLAKLVGRPPPTAVACAA